jgi:hypothetical protein
MSIFKIFDSQIYKHCLLVYVARIHTITFQYLTVESYSSSFNIISYSCTQYANLCSN